MRRSRKVDPKETQRLKKQAEQMEENLRILKEKMDQVGAQRPTQGYWKSAQRGGPKKKSESRGKKRVARPTDKKATAQASKSASSSLYDPLTIVPPAPESMPKLGVPHVGRSPRKLSASLRKSPQPPPSSPVGEKRDVWSGTVDETQNAADFKAAVAEWRTGKSEKAKTPEKPPSHDVWSGTVDETQNAADFKAAVAEWRGTKPKQETWVPPAPVTPVASAQVGTDDVVVGQEIDFDPDSIKFTSKYSFADRLLLDRYRREAE